MAEEQAVNGNGVHIKTRWGTLDAKRGSELIALVCLLMMAATGFGAWTLGHSLVEALNRLSSEQWRMTCIISLDQDERKVAFNSPFSPCNDPNNRSRIAQ